jgi:hypothetical protein
MSACRLLPYMTPLSHHVGECIARDRESPRKSPTSYVHTLYYGTITRTLSPFPPIKYMHPAGRSPSRRVRIENYSFSLSLSLSRSVDADARRPTIDRARARSSLVVVDATDARTRGREGRVRFESSSVDDARAGESNRSRASSSSSSSSEREGGARGRWSPSVEARSRTIYTMRRRGCGNW